MSPTNIATRTAEVAHDTEFVRLNRAVNAAEIAADRAIRSALHHAGYGAESYFANRKSVSTGLYVPYSTRFATEANPEAITLCQVIEHARTLTSDYVVEAIAALDKANTARANAIIALETNEDEYTGWTRFFLVVSSAGHVHSSRSCHTCNKGRRSTQFALTGKAASHKPEAATS
jgi:hypothetical protein